MGRKSKKARMIKPFCYFCLREFDNEKILIQHQKAKHFKCSECNRKLETANGLMVHMQQVHKITQRRVPNSLEGRDNINSSIQGMNGVPPEVIEEHRMQHFQKLNNLNKQKQQRINWTQVHAPGLTDAMNLNVNLQTNGSQAGVSGLQSSNFTNAVDSSGNSVTNNLLNEDTFTADASEEMMSSANKLLILDPDGMPIYQPAQPTTQQQTNTSQSQLFSLQQQNKLSFKRPYNDLSQSGFDTTNTTGFTSTPVGSGFSSAPSLQSNNFTTSSPTSSSNTPPVLNKEPVFKEDDLSTSANNLPDDDTFSTVHYKVTGLQPLYIPTPSLGNTKLSYTSDSVSIEELRAKVKYNWHETPS